MEPQLIKELTQESFKLIPIIGVIWYMLKDVRSAVKELIERVHQLELKVASENASVKIEHSNEKIQELKTETKSDLKDLTFRVTFAERQLSKLWSIMDDRPDIINREKEFS